MPLTGEVEDYPLPWWKGELASGIVIRDANGTRVLFIPFTGKASVAAKRKVARLILEAVNGAGWDTPPIRDVHPSARQ